MANHELFTRSTPTDLEVRSSGDGRTVIGICAPFNSPTQIRELGGSFTETIQRGAFARTIAERGNRVKFLAQHDNRAMPLGRATLLREDANGLYGEFHVSETQAGDEVLALVRDGALDSLSVGFNLIRENRARDGSRTILEARLIEVSAVTFPAYADALISGVRHIQQVSPEQAARRLELLRITHHWN
ncbi:HK97 family phage prohead protease [Rhodococcus sp. 311R]|uniref:HK97 family phage prohead protease n=1 Tax=Rhodococcus sp. 311R TaxID=1617904 RepID=UPI00067E9E84|nr:HK97 family phage prohead protease [Rhodococcus sp. 311R]